MSTEQRFTLVQTYAGTAEFEKRYGKERPIALGSDEASWAQNRRAVTIVLN